MRGWTDRWERAKTEELAGMDGLVRWLADTPAARPPGRRSSITISSSTTSCWTRANPGRVEAVLDWEMATVGDPLVDLGCTLCYWTQAGDPEMRGGSLSGITAEPGW